MTASAGNVPSGVSPDRAATQRQSPLIRWFRTLRPREVLIFVSSPQDCAAERDAVRRVVTWLNDQPEVARQRVRFRALLWEDLPPGVTEDGDFQKRIDTLMRRFGYDAYGIYLGIMKGRLGTPTPRYRSGTIEELEASLKSRQRSGLPSEVLFYFLVPDAEQVTEVREFRSELERRGFLSAGVTADQFHDRLTGNLFEIASSWNSWTNVLRRTWRRFGIGIVAAVSLLAVSVVGADLGSRWRINQALDRGDIAGAAQLWRGWSLLMPLSGSGVRWRINERAAGNVGAEPSLERQLNLLADWRRDPAFLPAAFALPGEDLGTRAERAIEAGVLESPDPRGVDLWRAARRAGVWPDDAGVAARLLKLLAEGRLLRALTVTGISPERWENALIRPEEAASLKRLVRRILERTPDLAGWEDRKLRIAIAVLAGDGRMLATLAAKAVTTVDEFDQPELNSFMATAEPSAAVTWLREVANPSLPLHIIGRIVDSARARGEPQVIVALADLVASGRLPEDAGKLLEDTVCPLPACTAPATERLVAWADGALLSEMDINLLVPALDAKRLNASERKRFAQAIVAHAQENGSSPKIVDALSLLDDPDGSSFLDDLITQHAQGSISFGFAEREALIDHLRRHDGLSGRLVNGRTIMLRSENDADALGNGRNAPFGMFGLASVERAYLDLLAEAASIAVPEDRDLIGRIVERMAHGDTPLSNPRGFEALGRALLAIPAEWRFSLFAYPPPPVVDPPWDAIWDRRRLLL
jgi:hypothetical protein